MKNFLIKILIGACCLPSFCGCSLEEENIRSPYADMYYKTIEGAEDLINSCYSYTRQFYGRPVGFIMQTLGTDLWQLGGDSDSGVSSLALYNPCVPSDLQFWSTWNNFYLGITACNTFLDRKDDIENISQEQLDNLTGQALFMRALYYHILVMHFGDIPLQLHEVTEVQTTAIRTPEKEVYAQIVADLLEAEKLLPVTQNEYGRATKPAAQALLARVYLWTGQYGEASTYAKKLINDYDFKLLDDYADLWDIKNEQNAEVIWAIVYTTDSKLNGSGNDIQPYFTVRYDNNIPGMKRSIEYGRPYRNYMPTRYLLDLNTENSWWDSRFEKSFRTVWYANNEQNLLPDQQIGDTALWIPPYAVPESVKEAKKNKYTIKDINSYFNESKPDETVGARELYPQLIKYNDPTRATVSMTNGANDFVVFRLAEMYLIAAEALMQEGRKDEGVDYINEVRKRAARPGKELAALLTPDQLTIDAILEERALELTAEYVGRWIDLKRTGKLIERVRKYNPDARPNIQEKHLLRPIPSNMMDRVSNKDEFKQNPEY